MLARGLLRRGHSTTSIPNIERVLTRPVFSHLVTDLPKLSLLPTEQINSLWNARHDSQPLQDGRTMRVDEYSTLKARALVAPQFVLPVVRAENKWVVFFSEFKDDFVLMTFVDEYKRLGAAANPHVSISMFDEIKGTVLVQTNFTPFASKREAQELTDSFVKFYTDDTLFEHVVLFNKKPQMFDVMQAFPEFAKVVARAQEEDKAK